MQMVHMTLLTAAAILSLGAGCGQSEIKTYRVAKEEKPALPAAPAGGHGAAAALPHVHGETPAGWEEQPAEKMRAASFKIPGSGGRQAQMALIPMPGATGIELQSINLWREELGLPLLTAETYPKEAQAIQAGDSKGHFFAMDGTAPRPGEDFKRGTLGAVFDREGTLWFAKLTGEGTLVAEQKDHFQAYLKSLEFHSGSHDAPAAAAPRPAEPPRAAAADSSAPKWNPPAHWKDKAPGPMITTAFSVDGADVTISKLSGEGGGMVANVNRWRGQLGLASASEAELQKSVSLMEVAGQKNAYLADLKGAHARTQKSARMLAVGVPRGGETWFFKLLGDEAAVEKEKDAFVKFIASAF